jgi:hypothetical protein
MLDDGARVFCDDCLAYSRETLPAGWPEGPAAWLDRVAFHDGYHHARRAIISGTATEDVAPPAYLAERTPRHCQWFMMGVRSAQADAHRRTGGL